MLNTGLPRVDAKTRHADAHLLRLSPCPLNLRVSAAYAASPFGGPSQVRPLSSRQCVGLRSGCLSDDGSLRLRRGLAAPLSRSALNYRTPQ